MTTAERRQQQNAGIPESKALLNFVVYKGEFKKTVDYNRWSSHRQAIHMMRHVSTQLPLAGEKKTHSFPHCRDFVLRIPYSYK